MLVDCKLKETAGKDCKRNLPLYQVIKKKVEKKIWSCFQCIIFNVFSLESFFICLSVVNVYECTHFMMLLFSCWQTVCHWLSLLSCSLQYIMYKTEPHSSQGLFVCLWLTERERDCLCVICRLELTVNDKQHVNVIVDRK